MCLDTVAARRLSSGALASMMRIISSEGWEFSQTQGTARLKKVVYGPFRALLSAETMIRCSSNNEAKYNSWVYNIASVYFEKNKV